MLTDARIVTNGYLNGSPSIVAFTFSQPVNPNGDAASAAGDFNLEGYHVRRPAAVAETVNTDSNNPNVILAQFDTNIDPESYTIAVVDNSGNGNNNSAVVGASGPSSGLNNPLGSVVLGNITGPTSTTIGLTTGPNLVSAVVDPADGSHETILYTFDKGIQDNFTSADFGYYNATGAPGNFDGMVGSKVGTATVVVKFPHNVSSATRFVVLAGAVNANSPNNDQ
ncbi:MAG: hypothetical protein ACRDX8_15115, partial [Acidimicrobiales bacterium]